MNRRNFFKIAAPAALSPLMLNGSPLKMFTNQRLYKMLACQGVNDRALVMIQLGGGNDGLNTLIPIDQHAIYKNIRPNIGLNDTGTGAFVNLDNTLPIADQVGIQPVMTGLQDLYNAGKGNIIQATGYPNQNRSHFKATDLWFTGGDTSPLNFNKTTGWVGRFLDYSYPGSLGNPTTDMPDPLGIQLGDSSPAIGFNSFTGSTAINLTKQDVSGFYSTVSELGILPPSLIPNTDMGLELQYIVDTQESVSVYSQRISAVFNAGNNLGTYPDTDLANQLQSIARLISGGSKTKVFLAKIGGFDTHNNQVDFTDPSVGQHALLLQELFDAIKAFQDDLTLLGLADRVMTVTFSEFGRKAVENGNYGTDHGNLAPMFLVGNAVVPGITGTNVDLSNLDGSLLQGLQNDYRQVFSTLLQDWLGGSDDVMTAAHFDTFVGQKLPIIDNAAIVDPSCYMSNFLPIELVYFQAKLVEGQEVALEWQTSSEFNNDYFEVQRSENGVDFTTLFIERARGGYNITTTYTAVDPLPILGTGYYRLKQVDIDKKFKLSDTVAVNMGRNVEDLIKNIRIYPNPAKYDVNLVFTMKEKATLSLEIYDMEGHTLRSERINASVGFNKLNYDIQNLPKGINLFHLYNKALGFNHTMKVQVL